MNIVCVMGRLTKDPEIKVVSSGKKVARFSIAVDRFHWKNATDFISYVAWDKTAEFIEKYARKGTQAAVTGLIVTGSYTDKTGKKVYTQEVSVTQFELCGSKSDSAPKEEEKDDSFVDVPDDFAEDAPFE